MKIIFITLDKIDTLNEQGVYHDLLREFKKRDHDITVISPYERRFKKKTQVTKENNLTFINVWTYNIQKANYIEKIFSIFFVEYFFIYAINKFLNGKTFDIIIYTTPPITLTKVIKHLQKKKSSFTYLLLKDIFPQNAVDLGLISNSSLIYKIMRKKEIKLYQLSDIIGCMSKENLNYILKHNNYICKNKIEINPNCSDLKFSLKTTGIDFNDISIPKNKIIFICGGNLGKPQGLNYLIKNIEYCKDIKDAFFIISGDGTEYKSIKQKISLNRMSNVMLINRLPKEQFELLLKKCHVGIVSLDPRFTIPNFPSRMLPYMKNNLPIIFAVNKNTDCGFIAEKHKFGFYSDILNKKQFKSHIYKIIDDKQLVYEYGKNSYNYLKKNYTSENSYNIIMKHFQK